MDIRSSSESYINGEKVVGYRGYDFDSVAIIHGEFDRPMEFSMNNSRVVTEFIKSDVENPKFVEYHNGEQAYSALARTPGFYMEEDFSISYIPISEQRKKGLYDIVFDNEDGTNRTLLQKMNDSLSDYKKRMDRDKNIISYMKTSEESYFQDRECIGFQQGAMTVIVNDRFNYEKEYQFTNSMQATEYFPLNGIARKHIKPTTEDGFMGTSENWEDLMLATCINNPSKHPHAYSYYKTYTRDHIIEYEKRFTKELDIQELHFKRKAFDFLGYQHISHTYTTYERYIEAMLLYDIDFELGYLKDWGSNFETNIKTNKLGEKVDVSPRLDSRDNKCYVVNKNVNTISFEDLLED